MNKLSIRGKSAQAGFTLIELIVVIVILGILAATALPKFADLGADARMAKMRAAAGSLRSAAATFHAQWMVNGSRAATAANSTSINSIIVQEGSPIAFFGGYPDVGGDGFTNTAATVANSGIVVAANLVDYDIVGNATVLTVRADADHLGCSITYTQAVGNAAPAIVTTNIDPANC